MSEKERGPSGGTGKRWGHETFANGQKHHVPSGGAGHTNRLIHEKSPYLLQHAHNPVDWFPWGREAFDEAKKEDKPVFLSIGYSACHWCHVMEAESFEREDVAQILNENFVSIKVDREERPDLDEIYMTATQLATGRGGWPNSVWLTPDGRPWYAGTYFPPEDRGGTPGFKTVLAELAGLWRSRRPQVERNADGFAEAVRETATAGFEPAGPAPSIEQYRAIAANMTRAALDELRASFDERFGGFGGAPKFPPHAALALLFHEFRRTGDDSLLRMACATLDGIARGGIRDHVGGGFHRYSTDERWFLPHFEKMLYDNALLARAYTEAFILTGNEEYKAAAIGACDWVLREMVAPAGGFYSALDADSEGVEGKFYLWTRQEVLSVLGAEEGAAFCRFCGAEERGNFRDEASGELSGANVLSLTAGLGAPAPAETGGRPRPAPNGVESAQSFTRARFDAGLKALFERRELRVRPHRDDKVLAGWNGLMIGSLAFAGKHLGRPDYLAAAERAAGFVLSAMRKDGRPHAGPASRFLSVWREGEARLAGYLHDYAYLADGLLDLHENAGPADAGDWLREARSLMDVLKSHYWDENGGGFFLTADDQEKLLVRLKPFYDQPIPSGNGVAARVLVRLGALAAEPDYFEAARAELRPFLGAMRAAPQATLSLILAASMLADERGAASTGK